MAGHRGGPVRLLWSCVLRKSELPQPPLQNSLDPVSLPTCPTGCAPKVMLSWASGTQLEMGSAYLFLSLMWGGHGWVEGVAQVLWCQLWTVTAAWEPGGYEKSVGVLTDLSPPCNLCTNLRERSLRGSLVRALPQPSTPSLSAYPI